MDIKHLANCMSEEEQIKMVAELKFCMSGSSFDRGIRLSKKMLSHFGSQLKMLRGSSSVHEIAEKVGVTESALAAYEAGERMPRDEVKNKLAECYGFTIGE